MSSRSVRLGVHLYTVAFEWDPRKAASNFHKHGIRFADAVLALEDEHAVTMREDAYGEERWITIGMDAVGQVLVLVYAWRGDAVRLISARTATRRELGQYMENQ
jgi:uncharacterized DUF497 family protein